MSNSKIFIEVKGLHKEYYSKYESVNALTNINLKINYSDFIIILGPSGSGKTSFLNCLTGLIIPSQGEIFYNGQDIFKGKSKIRYDLRKHEIGFVNQFFNLYSSLTAKENVELPMMISKKMNYKECDKRSIELLNLVGLEQRMNNRISELSGGEQQRVAFARALANNSHLLIADEPTGNLDSELANDLISILVKLNTEKKNTIILVTHDTGLIRPGMRIIKMRDGKILGDAISTDATIKELQEENDLYVRKLLYE